MTALLNLKPLISCTETAVYVTAPVAGPCSACKRMAIFFVNRGGKTTCSTCDVGPK